MIRRALTVVLVLVAALPAGAIPVPFLASPNVELLANLPTNPGGIGGRFAVIGDRTYYFETGATGLVVYDATIPEAPVPVGALPIPHYENEDVDLSVERGILLVTQDSIATPGILYVVDISIPFVPRLAAAFVYPRSPAGSLPGHTASCILGCRYAWISGAAEVLSVDLADPAKPAVAGWFPSRAGSVHDVDVDRVDGTVWLTGFGGAAAYHVDDPADAVDPGAPIAVFDARRAKLIRGLYHNSQRPSLDLLLVTEENLGTCAGQGRFMTFRYDQSTAAISPLDQFATEYTDATYTNGRARVQVECSAHWFDHHDGLVAIGWYMQGVRFLDVSDPSNITEVGYWLGPGADAFAALFHPVARDVVYVPDNVRGLDVLRITR